MDMYRFIKYDTRTEEELVRFTSREVEMSRILEVFKYFLIGCGFHPNTVEEYLNQEE